MSKRKTKHSRTLVDKYPPSGPCACDVCRGYCARPGWWTVAQATHALESGLGNRMMLEIAPEFTFGVLSPAFRGSERLIATNIFAGNGCTFLQNDLCELFGTGHQPLECRFCHHERKGLGWKCHHDLEQDWKTTAGQALVNRWIRQIGLRYQPMFGNRERK
jgi:hypothetical protein